MWPALIATPAETVLAATIAFILALALLGVTLRTSGALARRGDRPREHAPQRAVGVARGRSQRPSHLSPLSPRDLARLTAYRSRARFMAGEPLQPDTWWRKVRFAWKEGYAGWIIASLVGAFSMATHFGAYWLIAGGGWPGAIAITVLATFLMAAACAWIGSGLIASR